MTVPEKSWWARPYISMYIEMLLASKPFVEGGAMLIHLKFHDDSKKLAL